MENPMEPTLQESAGEYAFSWPAHQAVITAARVQQHSDGRVGANISVFTKLPGYVDSPLYMGQFNLAAVRSRSELANQLEKRCEDTDWSRVIEVFCATMLVRLQQGEPVKLLSDEVQGPPLFLLAPLLPLNAPTVLFGPGGSAKTLTALLLSLLLQNGIGSESLSLYPSEPIPVLYLDWEGTFQEMSRRCRLLKNGMFVEKEPDAIKSPLYRECRLPFVDDLSEIAKAVAKAEAKMIVVDSLGVACAGEMESAEVALRFFNALRQLPVTSLLVSHVTKAQLSSEKKGAKAPFGSIYFENAARMTWEIIAQEPEDTAEEEQVLKLGLYNRKSNYARLAKPIGAHVTFAPDFISVDKGDPTEDFPERLGQGSRALTFLKEGEKKVSEIAEYLGTTPGYANVLLTRLRKYGRVQTLRKGYWSLPTRQDDT